MVVSVVGSAPLGGGGLCFAVCVCFLFLYIDCSLVFDLKKIKRKNSLFVNVCLCLSLSHLVILSVNIC